MKGAFLHIMRGLASVALEPEAPEEWTLDEFHDVRPDLTDEATFAHVRSIYNAAIRMGKTRERVIETVDGLMLEALPGEVVPIPVLFGALCEDIIPVHPGGVWVFGQEAEACRDKHERQVA